MPKPGHRWRHLTMGTKSSWLPGDDRGWRSRKHRRHSSGDYKKPPPKGEHEGLHEYCEERSADQVEIPFEVRPLLGRALIEQFEKRKIRLLALAVSSFHTHALAEIIDEIAEVKKLIGQCKGAASFAIREVLPGSIWAEGASYKPVDDPDHHLNTFDYVLYEQGPSAWTWSFRDGSVDGSFDRKKPGPKGPA